MLLAYGKKFTDQWGGTDPDKLYEHWRAQLSGFSPDEIARGVAALEYRDWPPTLPEFKKMCRPPVDPTVAYYEAVSGMEARANGDVGVWSHKAIYWAAVRIGAFDLKNQGYSALKVRWEQALKDEMNKGQWADIPEPRIALPAPGKTELSKEEAKQKLDDLNASGILEPKNDEKGWARKILRRHQQGDKTLLAIQIKFANEALGLA